jgi:predicted TIM-barrel fold metal-dependent hydrolase
MSTPPPGGRAAPPDGDPAALLPQRVVDAHHHLWDLAVNRYPWLSGPAQDPADPSGLGILQSGYGGVQYLADTSCVPELRSVHVEAAHDPADPVRETAWLDAGADRYGVPDVIVGYAALEDPRLADILGQHARSPRLRGIRQMLDLDPGYGSQLLTDPAWHAGLQTLARHGLSFDLQVLISQLPAAAQAVRKHPEVTFVLNHGGYHAPASQPRHAAWIAGLAELASCGNVYVKSSGYADVDPSWSQRGLTDYVARLLDAFGTGRVMFGSNFPVDRRTVTFAGLIGRHARAIAHLVEADRDSYFYRTAARVYRIPDA